MAKLLHENRKPRPLPKESLVHISLLNALRSPAAENLHILFSALLLPVLAGSFGLISRVGGGIQDASWLVVIQWPVSTHSQAHVFGVVMLVISTRDR